MGDGHRGSVLPPTRFAHRDLGPRLNNLARQVVDACFEVRRELGAGLVESVYVECLADELRAREIATEAEVQLPIVYKGRTLGRRFRVDLLVDGQVVVEAKAVEELHPVHTAQLLTYLRLSCRPLGFLVNFNAVPLGSGILRYANTRPS